MTLQGVRPASESSIELAFEHEGERCVHRLRLKPTLANLRRAAQLRAAILDAIARGEYAGTQTVVELATSMMPSLRS